MGRTERASLRLNSVVRKRTADRQNWPLLRLSLGEGVTVASGRFKVAVGKGKGMVGSAVGLRLVAGAVTRRTKCSSENHRSLRSTTAAKASSVRLRGPLRSALGRLRSATIALASRVVAAGPCCLGWAVPLPGEVEGNLELTLD